MKKREPSKELLQTLALFDEYEKEEENQETILNHSETYMYETTDKLNNDWKQHVLLQDGKHVISIDIYNKNLPESDTDAHEQAIVVSWVGEKNQPVYHLKYLEDGGRFSPRILTGSSSVPMTFEKLIKLLLQRTENGVLLKKESVEDNYTIYAIRVFDIRKESIPLSEVLLYECFTHKKRTL